MAPAVRRVAVLLERRISAGDGCVLPVVGLLTSDAYGCGGACTTVVSRGTSRISMDSSRYEGRDDVRLGAHGTPRFSARLILQQEVDHRWRVLEKMSSYERNFKTCVVRGLLEAIIGCNLKVNHTALSAARPRGV